MRRKWSGSSAIAMLAALGLVAGLVGGVACTSLPTRAGSLGASGAPIEVAGLTSWLNSGPLTIASLRAKKRVVLIDFWTYSCINCQRTLPYVKQWNDRYAKAGLTIIGVHTPEFDFEHDPANVKRAVEAAGITYPVALDNDMQTWTAFNNNAWPAKYLIGADGRVRYTHFGEGDYDVTERAIRDALTAAGHDVTSIPTGGLVAPKLDPYATTITRELYGGYARNYDTRGAYAAQRDYYSGPNQTHDYTDITGERAKDVFYLQGAWRDEADAVVHARTTTNLEDYLVFRFFARSVNIVMRPVASGTPYDVIVELSGKPLRRDQAGPDVHFDASGRSLVTVVEPRMYAVVILPELGDEDLTLRSNSPDFSMYGVAFGAYTSGS